MKFLLLFAVVSLLMSVTTLAKDKNSVEQEVLNLEKQWVDALIKGDTAFLEKFYTDDLTYTHSNGLLDSKRSYIDKLKSGASKYQSVDRDEIKVAVHGDTALVTCHWTPKSMSNGNQTNTNARYLHVYVKTKDGWKMAAHQSTSIVK